MRGVTLEPSVEPFSHHQTRLLSSISGLFPYGKIRHRSFIRITYIFSCSGSPARGDVTSSIRQACCLARLHTVVPFLPFASILTAWQTLSSFYSFRVSLRVPHHPPCMKQSDQILGRVAIDWTIFSAHVTLVQADMSIDNRNLTESYPSACNSATIRVGENGWLWTQSVSDVRE